MGSYDCRFRFNVDVIHVVAIIVVQYDVNDKENRKAKKSKIETYSLLYGCLYKNRSPGNRQDRLSALEADKLTIRSLRNNNDYGAELPQELLINLILNQFSWTELEHRLV